MTMPAGDVDRQKGAVEGNDPHDATNSSMAGQLSHRDQEIKPLDSDFPEPGQSPEHSGEDANLLAREDDYQEESSEANGEGARPEMDPGRRQKRNQGDQKEDPLAA